MDSINENIWTFLPYPSLFQIFSYLDYTDLISVSEVCKSWYQVSRDDFLWKRLFYKHFAVDCSVPLPPDRSWLEEFIRLYYNIPIVETEVRMNHMNQVLHVSFSHNGDYFATCSKDGYVIVWNSKYPVSIKYSKNMTIYSWKYTQFSQFNESDTLLLVSGVHFGSPHSTSGEIAVFKLDDNFDMQYIVVNKPYDIFGTWYSDQHIFSGDLSWLAHLVSASTLRLHKVAPLADPQENPIRQNMFRFYNRNASSVRSIIMANCLSEPQQQNEDEEIDDSIDKCVDDVAPSNSASEHGNPLSHRNMNAAHIAKRTGEAARNENAIFSDEVSNWELANHRICYDAEYHNAEIQMVYKKRDSVTEDMVDTEWETIGEHDKYLIFITGYKTYSPHQIGFKRIKPLRLPKRMGPELTLREQIFLRERRRELSYAVGLDVDWLNYEAVASRFDKIDHLIDLHGHIVGMGLSPDHRYLYVNSRSWPQGYRITNPLNPPPIAQEIDIHVIDLVTLKPVGKMLRAHKAYTQDTDCFFIFLDVSDKYVASGAEDKHGYMWDRHYGACVAKYPHADVVNSVAFNPRDPEMLITASDDHKIKVWRSRAKVKELGLDGSSFSRGIEVKNHHKKRK